MTRALFWIGSVFLAFGVGAYRVLGEFNAFSGINLALGAAALLTAVLGLAARIRRSAATTVGTGNILRALLRALLVVVACIAVVALVAASDLRFDWTFEQRYAVSPATQKACAALPPDWQMTVYYRVGDPRIRNTRLLLEEIARHCAVQVRSRKLDEFPEDEDRYAIGSSNSVILEVGDRWERVERPTEGALYEAIRQLAGHDELRILYMGVGAGEGDLERGDELGFSGLRAALEIEGYELRPLPTAAIDRIPDDADGVMLISPQRPLRTSAVAALEEYLNAGGTLLALLDPGSNTGLTELLARFGITSRDALVVDPDSGPVDGDLPGLSPIAYNYGEHPISYGLDRNRHTFFRRSRSFHLRKPQRNDKLEAVVYASGNSWLLEDLSPPGFQSAPDRPQGVATDYHPLVVTGRFPRGEAEARIVAFGDSDFASNRYLRTLYNLDLVVNAVHWAVRREAEITIRPKIAELIQFPVPLQSSLQALYGVGLLVPELLLVLAGVMWLRSRTA